MRSFGRTERAAAPLEKKVVLGTSAGSAERAPTTETESAKALRELLAAVEKLKQLEGGAGLLQEVGKSLAQNKALNVRQLEMDAQKESDQALFRQLALERFTQLGIARKEQGKTIVDVEALKTASLASLGFTGSTKGALPEKQQERFKAFLDDGFYRVLATTFQSSPVITTEEWERAKREGAVPAESWLLYWPRTLTAATSPQSIRGARFQLAPWDLKGIKSDGRDVYSFPDGTLTLSELTAAGMIYHPSCGAGERDANGVLWVKGADGKTKEKISGQWFVRHGFSTSSSTSRGTTMGRPTRWLAEHPVLREKDILRDADFTTASVHSSEQTSDEAVAKYTERTKVTGNGNVTFNGIVHHLGRELQGRTDLLIANISSSLGLCSVKRPDGSLEPLFTFHIFQKSDPEIQRLNAEGKFLQVGLGLIDKTSVPKAFLATPVSSDTAELALVRSYVESRTPGMRYGAEVDKQLRLSADTLPAFKAWIEHTNEPYRSSFQGLVDRYGERAAKFCLQFTREEFKGLYKFCQKTQALGQAAQVAIMERCLVLTADGKAQAEALVSASFQTEAPERQALERKVADELTVRWKRVFQQLADEKQLSFEQLQVRLANLDKENAVFSAVFRTLFKGKSVQEAFQQMDGLVFDAAVRPTDIDARTKKDMLAIFDANWADQDATAAKSFKTSLERTLNSQENQTQFYLLKKLGEVMAYIRFDDRPDLGPGAVYGGSLNVHPAFRQSGVGEVVMQKTIEQVAQSHVIHAHVVPEAIAGATYVEQMRCVITGVDLAKEEKSGKQSPILRLRRDDARHYRTRQSATSWEALRHGAVPGVEVKSFDLATHKEAFVQAIREAAAQGKVVTRYTVDHTRPSVRWIAIEREVAPKELQLPTAPQTPRAETA